MVFEATKISIWLPKLEDGTPISLGPDKYIELRIGGAINQLTTGGATLQMVELFTFWHCLVIPWRYSNFHDWTLLFNSYYNAPQNSEIGWCMAVGNHMINKNPQMLKFGHSGGGFKTCLGLQHHKPAIGFTRGNSLIHEAMMSFATTGLSILTLPMISD